MIYKEVESIGFSKYKDLMLPFIQKDIKELVGKNILL